MKAYTLLFAVVLTLAGIAKSANGDDPTKSVIPTVIAHLAKQDLGIYPDGKTLYVSRVPLNAEGRLNETQLRSDTDGKPIPAGIAASFRSENTNAKNIPDDQLKAEGVSIGDFSPVGDLAFSEKSFPDSKALVNFYLPGYSTDKTFALVRLVLSPTAHGSTGTYLLRRDGNQWKVVWFKLAFYM